MIFMKNLTEFYQFFPNSLPYLTDLVSSYDMYETGPKSCGSRVTITLFGGDSRLKLVNVSTLLICNFELFDN